MEDVIKSKFKILSERKKSKVSKKTNQRNASEANLEKPEPVIVPILPSPPLVPIKEVDAKDEKNQSRKVSSDSLNTRNMNQDEYPSNSHSRWGHSSHDSVYVFEEQPEKSSTSHKMNIGRSLTIVDPVAVDEIQQNRTESNIQIPGGEEQRKKPIERRYKRRKLVDNDRRRNTWLPCTVPQYKVSKDLATRRSLQAVFFAKILLAKAAQLFLINIIVLLSFSNRSQTLDFFVKYQDWVYFAYGIFISCLLCIRYGLGYRSRWPLPASIIMMTILTIFIASMSASVATMYGSILVLLVESTIFLTFLMLSFVPYLLRESVMNFNTNVAASTLTFLSSVIFIFLKQFEIRHTTYWDFVLNVWLPCLVLTQMAVQITLFEIQRILFGLCFNVSARRWHIAAMYI